MSIHDEILDRVYRRMLFPVLPRARGVTIRRALFVSEGLNAVLSSPEGEVKWERRVAELQADLEVFVEARTIDPKYLFLLYPLRDAVWEIRSVRMPRQSVSLVSLRNAMCSLPRITHFGRN